MIPFMKAAEFSYQNEYRIVVDTAKDGDSPLKISVGAIGDITAKMPSSAIANAFRLNLEPEG